VDYWRTELLAKNEENTDLVLMLIGNKVDLLEEDQARIMHAKGLEYAQKHKMLFEETSAKTGSNVKAAFAKLLSSELVTNKQKMSNVSHPKQIALRNLPAAESRFSV
jgi:GTPase SAR1 family protein